MSFFLDDIMFRLMDLIRNPVFDYVMNWFSHLGSIFIILIIITSLFMWEERKKEWIPILLASFFIGLAASYIFKFIVMRPRPIETKLFFGIPDYSFPSSHSAIAFSSVPVLDREFPKLKFFWIGFALMVAVSRIYLGMHHFSDVVAGAMLGNIIGKLIIKLEEKHRVFRIKS